MEEILEEEEVEEILEEEEVEEILEEVGVNFIKEDIMGDLIEEKGEIIFKEIRALENFIIRDLIILMMIIEIIKIWKLIFEEI